MRSTMLLGAASLIALPAAAPASQEAVAPASLLASIFSDHMVLQRNRPIELWGWTRPGTAVTARIGEKEQRGTADADGRWQLHFPARTAATGLTIDVRAANGAQQRLSDVAVGDVFLCSGQSNMEFPVERSLNPQFGIAKPIDRLIRYMKIERTKAPAPQEALPGGTAWFVPEAERTATFSAVCMFFGREVAAAKQVPVGLIQASWGGTQIEAWMPEAGLRPIPGYSQSLDLLDVYARDRGAGFAAFGRLWESWWQEAAEGSPWMFDAAGVARLPAAPALGDWKDFGDAELAGHVGMVWFHRTIDLTPEQAAGARTLRLGDFGEIGAVWINGRFIGSVGGRARNNFDVPAGLLRSGANAITVNILQTNGNSDAGLLGPASAMNLAGAGMAAIPLSDGWRYQRAEVHLPRPPRAPWEDRLGVSVIYNGMIAPLGPLPLAGVVWYQGESNAARGEAYRPLLENMMAGWRSQFRRDLPFVIIQLANFGELTSAAEDDGWAQVREAQRRVADTDPHAALAVTIDIGEKKDIHPPLKLPVGQRAWQAARKAVYREQQVAPSGPAAVSATLENGGITIRFRDIGGHLMAASSHRPAPFMVCATDGGECRFVDALLEGDKVRLEIPAGFGPTRVRYCWAASPICNLYDTAQNPVGPFELSIAR